ncbi:MAG: cofactor-independent phosphoglycerate mutase [Candidatus Omnitrophota bacterium]
MKYIVLVGDGMADRPLKDLDGKTPLEVARIPNMDFVAKEGTVGCASTIPESLSPASDVANMALLGYDPVIYYTGRGPLEAANMGIELSKNEIAFRCNLVTVAEEKMADYSAGHISNKEAATLIKFIDKKLGSNTIRFYPGVSYRHLAVVNHNKLHLKKDDLIKTLCTPPHDILNRNISRYMPNGAASGFLTDLMLKSKDILSGHDINKVRLDLNENPGNMVWLWGQGTKPEMPSFYDKFKLHGSIISAVDLIKGIGKIIGLDVMDVPGATGYYDTDYLAKAKYALESLKKKNFVFVHVEAPDEAGHNGDIRAKITAIENFDRLVVGTILGSLRKGNKDFKLMVLPDHATPISVRTHTRDPIPFAMYGNGIEKDGISSFNEPSIRTSNIYLDKGHKILEMFIKGH